MYGLKNTLTTFLFIGVFIAFFIGLVTILAKVFVVGAIIGLVLYAFFWLKNKLFPQPQNPLDQNFRKFRDSVYFYSKTTNNYGSYNKSDNNQSSASSQSRSYKSTGRIIDVEPEDQ